MATTAGLIGVTGATGRLGARVAQRIAAAGVEQRLLARDPSRAPQLAGATVARASFENSAAVREALTGISTLLMVSASENADRLAQHTSFVDAAAAAGVEHLVYISFYGAAPDCTFTLGRDHYATEQHIRASGLTFTFLRDNLYADFFGAMVGEDGILRGPAGDGRVAAVAIDDIADVAAAVLTDPQRHIGATYRLTGPESLTLDDVAAALSTALDRPVSYHPETVEEAYHSRAAYDAPSWQVDAWVSTYTAIAKGEVAAVTDDVPRLTGHPATSLAELLRLGGSAYQPPTLPV
jgi:NAD(P)H dehydrogenase (quinone)